MARLFGLNEIEQAALLVCLAPEYDLKYERIYAFLQNDLVQDAVIRNLEILGEASNHIQKHYPEFVGRHPELPLAFAYVISVAGLAVSWAHKALRDHALRKRPVRPE